VCTINARGGMVVRPAAYSKRHSKTTKLVYKAGLQRWYIIHQSKKVRKFCIVPVKMRKTTPKHAKGGMAARVPHQQRRQSYCVIDESKKVRRFFVLLVKMRKTSPKAARRQD
jgi:hypothetical protein